MTDTIQGTAYGAQSGTPSPGMWDNPFPLLDVQLEDGQRVQVASEEPYASDIAEQIAEAGEWAELPTVSFEEYQIVGAGR